MDPHINIYLFEQGDPRVEVLESKKKVDVQSKNLGKTEKTCRELKSRVDSLTWKAN